MSNCPSCKRQSVSNKTVIKHGQLISGCEACIDSLVQGTENARSYDRRTMVRDNAKDLVQPFNKDFVKAYGVEKAREHGWSDNAIRKFS